MGDLALYPIWVLLHMKIKGTKICIFNAPLKYLIYRLGTNFGHFQALFNVLRFSQTFPAKFACIQLLHILSIIKH